MIQVFHSVREWRQFSSVRRRDGFGLGFVPTMGALHEGHLSLCRRSNDENDRTLVSIFVNPTQFDDPRDLDAYPRSVQSDLALLEERGVHYALLPGADELYADGYRYRVNESGLSGALCGAHRPGHFDGVLTVVLKLLLGVGAQRAYFGEKDYQQFLLVKGMAEAFFVETQIVPGPTVRESDGLAMSSRNARLGPEERKKAPAFAAALRESADAAEAAARLRERGFEVDYVEDRMGRRFGAVRIGGVRLIDNISLEERRR